MLQKKYKEISQIEKFRDINEVIEGYMPMIIKTISDTTGKYVSAENSEELSIGLMAFIEAIERYEEERGEFTSFAKLIIKSRVI
ncbi:MAG: sigma factor, partial [Cellulosilyticaceae bacterium]